MDIFSNACYSGNFAKLARKYQKSKDPCIENFSEIHVYSSTDSFSKIGFGQYKALIEKRMNEPEKDEFYKWRDLEHGPKHGCMEWEGDQHRMNVDRPT